MALSAAIALPITIALLLLMTRLILPSDEDRIVRRMIRNIELHRTARPPEPLEIRVYQRPLIEDPRQPEAAGSTALELHRSDSEESLQDGSPIEVDRARLIDWWAEARKLTQEADETALKRWLLEQGYESYVSVMQGALPITQPVETESPLTQEDRTGYMNSYGDMEYKISENCVATTQVAARLDHSDFAKALPMRITCKPRPLRKFDFDRDAQQ